MLKKTLIYVKYLRRESINKWMESQMTFHDPSGKMNRNLIEYKNSTEIVQDTEPMNMRSNTNFKSMKCKPPSYKHLFLGNKDRSFLYPSFISTDKSGFDFPMESKTKPKGKM